MTLLVVLCVLCNLFSSCLQKTAKSGLHILLGGVCALTVVVFFRFVSNLFLFFLTMDYGITALDL
jgi:hypothetical protein